MSKFNIGDEVIVDAPSSDYHLIKGKVINRYKNHFDDSVTYKVDSPDLVDGSLIFSEDFLVLRHQNPEIIFDTTVINWIEGR